MEVRKTFHWNYEPPIKYGKKYQIDWNQTLLTKLNQIIAENKLEYPIKLKVPIILKDLFETLEYYIKGYIENKYVVNFIVDKYDNVIEIEYDDDVLYELIIKNYDVTEFFRKLTNNNQNIDKKQKKSIFKRI